jgi:hypothetical protein
VISDVGNDRVGEGTEGCTVGKFNPPGRRIGRLHAKAGIRIKLSKLTQMIEL